MPWPNPARALGALLVCLAPAPVLAGVVDVLGAEIAKDAASQLAREKRALDACVYVDDSLSPGLAASSLARSIASSLSSQLGVRDVLDVGLTTLSEAPSLASSVGCDVAIVVAFDVPSKNARSRVWVLRFLPSSRSPMPADDILSDARTSKPLCSKSQSPAYTARAIGEPFSSSIVGLQSIEAKPPVDLSKGWRMQQIIMGQEPILALLIDSVLYGDEPASAMFALTRSSATAYRFDTRAKSTSPFSPPKELYRADLSSLPKATKASRDAVGLLVVERPGCAGDCLRQERHLFVRTSSLSSSYRLPLSDGFSTPQKLSPDEALNQLWPLVSEDQKILFGALEEGTNLFSKKLWWINTKELDKSSATKTEAPFNDRFYVASSTMQDKERRIAFVHESEELSLYQATPLSLLGSFGKVGAQLLFVDLEQDKSPEILSTSSDATGEGDTITLSAIEEKSLRKLWGSGTLYAPASAAAGKRPLSWVTALSAGDIDNDGSIEIIAALYSSAGSSILIISR